MRHLVLLAALACNAAPPALPGAITSTGPVAFNVNGVDVPVVVVETVIESVPEEQRKMAAQAGQAKQMLENVALGDVLYRQALERKLHEDPATQAKLAMTQREALAQMLLEKVVEESLTEAAILEAYEKRKVQYQRKEAKVRLIPVGAEAEAIEVVALLKAGADFAKVAQEKSLDKRLGETGGDLGWVSAQQLMPAVDAVLFGSTETGIIGPINAGGAWVVLAVDERREATPLDDVREELVNSLKQEQAAAYIEAERAKMNITWTTAPEVLLGGEAPAVVEPVAVEPAAPAAPAAE